MVDKLVDPALIVRSELARKRKRDERKMSKCLIKYDTQTTLTYISIYAHRKKIFVSDFIHIHLLAAIWNIGRNTYMNII